MSFFSGKHLSLKISTIQELPGGFAPLVPLPGQALDPLGSMPTGFFIWGYMYPFTFIFGGTSKFLGVQSLTLHLGVQRKLTAFSPHKVVHHAVFCKYYAELAKTFFFCLTLGQTGSGVLSDPWSLCLSHHFFFL